MVKKMLSQIKKPFMICVVIHIYIISMDICHRYKGASLELCMFWNKCYKITFENPSRLSNSSYTFNMNCLYSETRIIYNYSFVCNRL